MKTKLTDEDVRTNFEILKDLVEERSQRGGSGYAYAAGYLGSFAPYLIGLSLKDQNKEIMDRINFFRTHGQS